MSARLILAADAGAIAPDGPVGLFGAPGDLRLEAFGNAAISVIQPLMPDAADWQARGIEVVTDPGPAAFETSVVFLPRAKAEARARIEEAMRATAGNVLIDGQKTDGVESILKDMRKRADVAGMVSKAHGKLFWLATSSAFEDWAARGAVLEGRWHVLPGVFSADGIDPGSALLAHALPDSLSGRVADLGAGWGYLSAIALERCSGIREIHLPEAHAGALDCARRNVVDDRAHFHWADVTDWQADAKMDAVIMNPPFHKSRAADTGLGQAFIATAARILRPGGQLWMVANRHLPYEQTLAQNFAQVEEIGGDGKFKLFQGRTAR